LRGHGLLVFGLLGVKTRGKVMMAWWRCERRVGEGKVEMEGELRFVILVGPGVVDGYFEEAN